MAREAMIELNCISERKDITYIIDLLCNGGWTVFNKDGNVEYLPEGDVDDFCWQEDNISFEELNKIIEIKHQKSELVGIHLFYRGTTYGISVLSRSMNKIIISIDINRNTIGAGRNALTNFEWYFSNIILKLNQDDSLAISYKFEDYID